jgi:hypothetical protein
MTSTPQGARRRFAAAAFFFALSTASVAEVVVSPEAAALPAVAGTVVGTIQGPEGALFPGSRTGAYGFVRQGDGAPTYFRVNGGPTRAQRLDGAGRVVGTFEDAAGRLRTFVIPPPRGSAFVDVALDSDDDVVG